MLAILYSFGAGLLVAACALSIFILWRDHQRVTMMWAFLSRQQAASQPAIGGETEIRKGEIKK